MAVWDEVGERSTQKPISICAHCLKPLTASEIKLTIEGAITSWDERMKRCQVTLDYCSIGKEEIEKFFATSIRDAILREDKIAKMDEEDAKLRLAGRQT